MQNLKFVSQKLRNAMSFKTNTENSEKGITMKTTQNKLTTALLTTSTLMVLGTSALLAGPQVYFFNGMNTRRHEARVELDAIKYAVKTSYNREFAKNFNPKLIYTETFGKIPDALRIKFLRYAITRYVNDPKGFTTQYRRCTRPYGCKNASPSQIEFARITKDLIDFGAIKNNGAGTNDLPYFPRNSKVIFISYSRGNIFANMIQESYGGDESKVKRTNIASAGYHLFGNLFTSKSDTVIGTYTFRDRNYYPDYYGMLSDFWKDLFDNGYKKGVTKIYSAKDIRKYTNKYFFSAAGEAGHSLEHCYLNKNYGLYGKITFDIIQNYYDFGGR